MPRLPRCDAPGRWFHIFNRGIARRTVFETREDVRFFLACLARSVRRGELEIHAYCVMTTHFHLLVRSPTGQVAVAMDRVMNAYVRYFNRSRRRDGSLFRGRYGARPVDSIVYRRVLVRYIDRNAVKARLVDRPWAFPWGSAWHYVQPKRPLWLSTEWIDGAIRGQGHADPQEGYAAVFGMAWSRSEATLVRGRMRAPVNREEALDDLIAAAPEAVLGWMRRKAELADGRTPSLPSTDARMVVRAIAEEQERQATWRLRTRNGQWRDAWGVVEAYTLRTFAALGWAEIGRRLDVSPTMAGRRARQAEALITSDEAFGQRTARLARRVLDLTHGEEN